MNWAAVMFHIIFMCFILTNLESGVVDEDAQEIHIHMIYHVLNRMQLVLATSHC